MKQMTVGLLVGWLALQAGAAEPQWMTDLPAAQKKARDETRIVLMDFTGSDWCVWCKKLSKEVFSTPQFAAYAKTNLVLVELDFPSNKEQSKALKKANEALKAKYRIEGFPTVVALNNEGKQIWKHEGYLEGGPGAFIAELEKAKKKK